MKPSGLVIYCCEQTTLKHDDFKKLIISYICVLMGFSRVLLLFHLLSGTAVIWDSAGLEHPDGLLVCLGVEKAEVLGQMGLSHLSPPPLALSPLKYCPPPLLSLLLLPLFSLPSQGLSVLLFCFISMQSFQHDSWTYMTAQGSQKGKSGSYQAFLGLDLN